MSVPQQDATAPIRTFLYVPSTRPEWVRKALAAEPDAVILDLEDSVELKEKPRARALVPAEIETIRLNGTFACVKLNAMDAGALEDVRACVRPGLTAFLLPKASSPGEIMRLADALSEAEITVGLSPGQVGIIPMPETLAGMYAAHEIAKASPRVRGLMTTLGVLSGDVAYAFGFRPTIDGREQLYLQSKIILDSRAAGAMSPICGVFAPRIDDLEAIELLVQRAKQLGFSGVTLIHPSQVKIANAVFRPTEEEVAYFEGLIAAMNDGHSQGLGAVRYRGAMIDLAMLPLAQQVVEEAKRHRLRDSRRNANAR